MAEAGIFPSETEIEPWARQARGVIIEARGTFVPGWYVANPHEKADGVIVKQRGVPLVPTIEVGKIAPERRWPIGLDGELMDQMRFSESYKLMIEEFYKHGNNRYEGKIHLEPIPDVVDFVSWRIDTEDNTRLLPIHYDPYKTQGAVPEVLMDSEGENAIPRLEAIRNVDPGLLTARERQELAQVSPEPAPEPEPEPEPAPPAEGIYSACGKSFSGKRERHAHQLRCSECKTLRASVGADTSTAS